jgi:hypothetical protein
MKPPSEADLQEIENEVLPVWQEAARKNLGFDRPDRVVRTLEALIAIARDPSELLRSIPDDETYDEFLQAEFIKAKAESNPAPIPPRTVKAEPASKATPKPKMKITRQRIMKR